MSFEISDNFATNMICFMPPQDTQNRPRSCLLTQSSKMTISRNKMRNKNYVTMIAELKKVVRSAETAAQFL